MNNPTNVYDAIKSGMSFSEYKKRNPDKLKIVEKKYWQAVKFCVESEQSDNTNPTSKEPTTCSTPPQKSKSTSQRRGQPKKSISGRTSKSP